MPVKVTGLKELQRDLKGADNDLERKLLREDLKKAAEPVSVAGRAKIAKYHGAKVSSIRPVATGRSVFVRQSQGKKTGRRGDFGSLQWKKLSAALDEHEDDVRERREDAVTRSIKRHGLT